MSDDFVTFNVRYGKSLFELKITTPGNVSGFIETLRDELQLGETHELVLLCPTSDGKMLEIQSDDDIEFLKKTKLAYNAVTKEIYCNVELVVTVIHEMADDTKTQLTKLSKKIDRLAFSFDEFKDDFNKKMYESKTDTASNRSILAEQLQIDSGNRSKNNSLGEGDVDIKPIIGLRQKKTKKDKEKLSSTTAGTNNNSSTTSEKLKSDVTASAPPTSVSPTFASRLIPKDIDILLDMLTSDGFTNTIQNIIVLKRFDNDYEKARNYLKSSST